MNYLNSSCITQIRTSVVISKEELEGAKDAARAARRGKISTLNHLAKKLSIRNSKCEAGDLYNRGVVSILRDIEKVGLEAAREKYSHPLTQGQLRLFLAASRESELNNHLSRTVNETIPTIHDKPTAVAQDVLAKNFILLPSITSGQKDEGSSHRSGDSKPVSKEQSLQLSSIFYAPTIDNLSGGIFNTLQAISDSYGWTNLPREMMEKTVTSSVRQGSLFSRFSSFIGGVIHPFKGDKTSGIPVVVKLSSDAVQGARIYSASFVNSLKQMRNGGVRAAAQMIQGVRIAASTLRPAVATLSNAAQFARSQSLQIRSAAMTGAGMAAAFTVGAGEYLLAFATLNPIGAALVVGGVLVVGSYLVYRSLES